MAWDEWEQLKANASGSNSAQTRLNQVAPPSGDGGGPADLASTPAEKRTAANAIEQHLEPGTAKAGNTVEISTESAVSEFRGKDGHGWDTSTALKKAHAAWEKQVKSLVGRLSAEKYALRETATRIQNTDIGIGTQFRQQSQIDKH
ncbi:hypothetical protein ACFQVC_03170 [Streptomyces monticola]|uniref:Uncharacterized protein n=1 Tax=Streptomyces monticola TaxID=2666263 RepID=A0ABW2JCF5_9ACTN